MPLNLCSGDSGGAALRETDSGYLLAGGILCSSAEGSQPCVGCLGAARIDAISLGLRIRPGTDATRTTDYREN